MISTTQTLSQPPGSYIPTMQRKCLCQLQSKSVLSCHCVQLTNLFIPYCGTGVVIGPLIPNLSGSAFASFAVFSPCPSTIPSSVDPAATDSTGPSDSVASISVSIVATVFTGFALVIAVTNVLFSFTQRFLWDLPALALNLTLKWHFSILQ